jgi:signal peptidase II
MRSMTPAAAAKASALIALGIAVDQLTKVWAQARLPGSPVEVLANTLSLVYVENRNAAFGFGGFVPDAARKWVLLALTGTLTIGLFVAMLRSPDLASRLGFGITVAGALGNIIDRARLGYVIDFIYWYRWFQWPNFNVADILVCTGIGVLVVFGGKKEHPAGEAPAGTPTAEHR